MRGFDPIAVMVSGFCADEGSIDAPLMPMTDIYADYLAAYVGAAAVNATLRRRAIEGGSYEIRLSLTRLSMWAREIGLLPRQLIVDSNLPFSDDPDLSKPNNVELKKNYGAFGEVTFLPSLIRMSKTTPNYARGPEPFSAWKPSWDVSKK